MMCVNATGSERCRLLVIGKAAEPRCFKGIKMLPVNYTSNKKSCMMEEIFIDWLRALDRKFAAQNGNVLMLVDNCSAHCDVGRLKAICLAFLLKKHDCCAPAHGSWSNPKPEDSVQAPPPRENSFFGQWQVLQCRSARGYSHAGNIVEFHQAGGCCELFPLVWLQQGSKSLQLGGFV